MPEPTRSLSRLVRGLALGMALAVSPAVAQSCGDCDGNAQVDILDALRIAQIDVGLVATPAGCADTFNACNVQGTPCPSTAATINVLDALIVAQFAVGSLPPPSCGVPVASEVGVLDLGAAASLPSTANTPAVAVLAWSLRLADAGSDGLGARVSALTLRRSVTDQFGDLSATLGAAFLSSAGIPLASGAISSDAILFTGLALDVADGGVIDLDLELALVSTPGALSGLDGSSLGLALAPQDLVTSPGGSAPAAQPAVESGAGNLQLAIVAAGLTFTVQPALTAGVSANLAPVTVAATDLRQNVDADAVGTITVSAPGAPGTLSSSDPGGLTHALAAGQTSWADLRFDAEALVRLHALSSPGGLEGDSSRVAVTSSPRITGVSPPRGPAGGGNVIFITGFGLPAGAPVLVDGVPARDVQALDGGLVTAEVPPAAAGRAGATVDVAVGALVAASSYVYEGDTVGPTLVDALPHRNATVIATTQRFAVRLDSIVAPGSVQDPDAAGTASTGLVQGVALAGAAHTSEDGRWIVLRRMAGVWSAGTVASAALFSETPGVSAIEDLHGNVVSPSTFLLGRAALGISTTSAVTVVPDTTAPHLVASVPAAGATGVPRGARLVIEFDEALDPSTVRMAAGGPVSAPTVRVIRSLDGAIVPGWLELSVDLRQVTVHLDQAMAPGQAHTLHVESEVEDLAGNALAPISIGFTTAAAPPLAVGLEVNQVIPTRGDIAGGNPIRIVGEGFAPGAGVLVGGATATAVRRLSSSELEAIAPSGAAPGDADVTVVNPDGSSATGVGLYAYDDGFPADPFEPELVAVFPPASSTGALPCARNSRIVLVMSEPVTVAGGIGAAGGIELIGVAGTHALAAGDRIAVITPVGVFPGAPTAFLLPHRAAAPSSGVRDRAGNRLLPFHPDRRFGLAPSGDAALGLSWSDGGLDVSAPLVVSRSPAPASSGNDADAPITITLSEPLDPVSVETTLAISDGAGAVPGAVTFDLVTMSTLRFEPSRAYVGTVSVDARMVRDLGGNALGGAVWTFTTSADTTAPVLRFLTLDGIPAHLNGDAAFGGGSSIGGRLRMPPWGFTIDVEHEDTGGHVSTVQADFTITASTTVGGRPPGTNLAPLFPPGCFRADTASASFLVPPGLAFPAGAAGSGAISTTITVRVRDRAGNPSPSRSFTFDCVEARGDFVPLDAPPERWSVEMLRNHDDMSYDLLAYALSPGGDGCPPPDAEPDFAEDLIVQGLVSFPPAFSPSGADPVASGGLSINQAARHWIENRIQYHVLRLYGIAAEWDDGQPNPGFAAARRLTTAGSGESVALELEVSTQPAGPTTNRIALGGYKQPGIGGIAPLDTQNRNRGNDVGQTCNAQNSGIFTTVDAATEFTGFPSSPGSVYRQLYDPLVPFTGGAPPMPLGSQAEDAMIVDPLADPLATAAVAAERQERVMATLDAFARRQAYLTAHEMGHAMGLLADGEPGAGLYGGDASFPGSTSGHLELRSFYPGDGRNLMSPFAPLDTTRSRFSAINELALAYLLGRALVAP